jgi:hypothetical protein
MDTDSTERPDWLALERVIPLQEVTKITSLSRDTLQRHHKAKIVDLSPRRRGMKLRHALEITNNGDAPAA